MTMWFPLPSSVDDIQLIELESLSEGGGFSPFTSSQIYELLHDSSAHEWRERVGVTNPNDGSGKSSTRLLLTKNLVFKTDTSQQTPFQIDAQEYIERLYKTSREVPLWHPQKQWFTMRLNRYWWPISVCPKLQTLRQLHGWEERTRAWIDMILFSLSITKEYDVGLDCNPANFAWDSSRDRLYYIDDEVYERLLPREFAEAIVTRIPEEYQQPHHQWEQWGSQLQQALLPEWTDGLIWRQLIEGIESYPLTPLLQKHRISLIKGLSQGNPHLDPEVRRAKRRQAQAKAQAKAQARTASQARLLAAYPAQREPQLTCIFSDTHGNIDALEAVLKMAKEFNVDSYMFLGDAVGYGPFPHECVQRIAELPNSICLRGNHDQMASTGKVPKGCSRLARETLNWTYEQLTTEDKQWLGALLLEYRDANWLAVHGAPQDPERIYAYVYEMTYRENLQHLREKVIAACFYGHTHVPFIYRLQENNLDSKLPPQTMQLFEKQDVLLINPGSVGMPRDRDPRASFALWDRKTNSLTFHRAEYHQDTIIAAIKKNNLPEDLISRLEMGW